MTAQIRLWLIGAPGVGKTTLGQRLSERLKCPWYDSDMTVAYYCKKSPEGIIAEEGEQMFRKYEELAIRQLATRPAGVISVGGGAPQRQANIDTMRSSGKIVAIKEAGVEDDRYTPYYKIADVIFVKPKLSVLDTVAALADLFST